MESPSPLSGWVTPEQAIVTLGASLPPSVKWGWWCLQENPVAGGGGERCLHVRCLVVPAAPSSPQPFPGPSFLSLAFARVGESG